MDRALRAAVAAGDPTRCRALLVRQAADLISTGYAATVRDAVRLLPADARDPALTCSYAEAMFLTGAVAEALTLYDGLSGRDGPLPVGLAWRHALARHLSGEPAAALALLRRAGPDHGVDGAMVLAWRAAVSWALGDADGCVEDADRAQEAARHLGDGRCEAAAHVALALSAQLRGDRRAVQAHQDRALRAAEAVGDVVSIVRIRTNRSSSLLHEARYADALDTVDAAVSLADRVGYAPLLAPALYNRSTALARLGRLSEAVAGYDRTVALCQGMGSDGVAYAFVGLGDVHRARRRLSQARAAYEEALRAVGDSGNRQVRAYALAGLARVLSPGEPAAAADLAARALTEAQGPVRATACVAAGWVAADAAEVADRAGPDAAAQAATDGAWERVGALAGEAAEAAREHRAVAQLAEALELAGYAAARRPVSQPAAARQALTEALAIWRDAGATLDADRVRLALSRVDGRSVAGRRTDRARASIAADRLAAAGVVGLAGATDGGVRIAALGRFEVSVGGAPVPTTAWQSRKARDLLRILVARRGRPVSREEAVELLWPGEPADRLGHRLSVALSTARTVLAPARDAPADCAIRAEDGSLALSLTTVDLDAETFADYAEYGLGALRAGQDAEARAALEAAERTYTGDFLEDDPYSDLAAPAREELRATFLAVVRALADLSRADGRVDDASRYLLRLLAVDGYDELAHRSLIRLLAAGGRHGEARRARQRFAAAMADVGIAAGRAAP